MKPLVCQLVSSFNCIMNVYCVRLQPNSDMKSQQFKCINSRLRLFTNFNPGKKCFDNSTIRGAKREKPAEMSAFFISPLSKPLILLIIAETRRFSGWVRYAGFLMGRKFILNQLDQRLFMSMRLLILKYLTENILDFDTHI